MFLRELEGLKENGLLREIKDRDRASPQGRLISIGKRHCLLNFASNDYLGLANHPAVVEAAKKALTEFGAGAGASRLLSGGTTLHKKLETALARFKGTGSALIFNSGYSLNTGLIPAVAAEGDALFSDELNHASIVDGCRLSRAKKHIYRHKDVGHLEELIKKSDARRKVVVTDAVFSMDGDIAPLNDLYALCKAEGAALYIDDAHGTGVTGKGKGTLKHFGLKPVPFVIEMGTLSKALGSFGAFLTGPKETVGWAVNNARCLIYSTALPPSPVGAALKALELVGTDGARIERLWANRDMLLSALQRLGLDTGESETPIIPVMLKDVQDALGMSRRLLAAGIYAPAIRPPTVKQPRLRLTVTASHTDEDIERLIRALNNKCRSKAT